MVYLVGFTYDDMAGVGFAVSQVHASRESAIQYASEARHLKDREIVFITDAHELDFDDMDCIVIWETKLHG